MNYLLGKFQSSERRLIVLAALVLLPVFFLPVLPIWNMKLWAPQYREGLSITIYSNTIRGDLQNINTLNHYVGMKAITPDDFDEFRYLPQALTAFGVLAMLGALFNRRWIAMLGWIAFTAFSGYMFADYANWLWHYGHDLDPRAAIKLPAFTPPLIGFKQMANFKVWSYPGPGTVLLGMAWLLGPIVLWLDWRKARAVTVILVGLLAFTPPAEAHTWRVTPAPGRAAAALAAAAAGDTVLLLRGTHAGPLSMRTRVVLRGEPGAVLHGGHRGSALLVGAPGGVVEDLEVRASGKRVLTIDSGIQVITAPGTLVRRVVMEDVLYGVYVERSDSMRVEGCRLRGRVAPLHENGEGNGIHLWYTRRPRLVGNDVSGFADAIYLSFVDDAEARGNRLERNGRYGLHTMYCQASRLVGNHFNRNAAGCAIMFSNRLDVRGNDFWRNRGPRTYGLLLRDCSDGDFVDNRMVDNTIAVFMDNSNRNRFHGNLVENNGWGVLMFSSCAGNEIAGNSFENNDYPVALDMRRTGNRFDDGARGNYWSDNSPYDLDGDGASDVPYSPVSAFSFVSKQYSDLSILAKSPAVAALSVAERVMPALRPSAAVDRFPRVRPVAARGTGVALRDEAGARVSAASVLGFGALALAGLAGTGARWRRSAATRPGPARRVAS